MYLEVQLFEPWTYRGHMILDPAMGYPLDLDQVQGRNGLRKSYKILIADDNDEDTSLLVGSFQDAHVPVECAYARDGETLVQMLSQDPDDFDLAVLDFYLPKKNAGEALATLRSAQRLPNFPIVVLSSFLPPHHQDALSANGVRRILTKPSELSEYNTLVTTLLSVLQTKEQVA
jgi:CheY-like chemotaxis protein